jgi:hypothetical protein
MCLRFLPRYPRAAKNVVWPLMDSLAALSLVETRDELRALLHCFFHWIPCSLVCSTHQDATTLLFRPRIAPKWLSSFNIPSFFCQTKETTVNHVCFGKNWSTVAEKSTRVIAPRWRCRSSRCYRSSQQQQQHVSPSSRTIHTPTGWFWKYYRH